jgi:hypothetical protein
MNCSPAGFDPARDLPKHFADFLLPLHRAFTSRQCELVQKCAAALAAAHEGKLPDYLPPTPATRDNWQIGLPEWCQDQRNQMTGPADDAELVVKMLNSGAPGAEHLWKLSHSRSYLPALGGKVPVPVREFIGKFVTAEPASRGIV